MQRNCHRVFESSAVFLWQRRITLVSRMRKVGHADAVLSNLPELVNRYEWMMFFTIVLLNSDVHTMTSF